MNRRARTVVAAALLSCALAACGSQIDPSSFEQTAGGSILNPGSPLPDGSSVPSATSPDGTAPDGTTVPGGTAPDGSVPGAVDPGGTAPGGTAPDGTAPGPGGEDPAPGGEGPVPEENAPAGDGPAGDCAGFANQTGVTDDTITIATISDVTGPVPGLFQSTHDATKAFAAYFNATTDICGRKLAVQTIDTRAEAGGDQQGAATACEQAFASIGGMSSQDQGGAAAAESCGLPDVRAIATTPARADCSTCFSTYALAPDRFPGALADYWKQTEPEAAQNIGVFYVNVEAARVNAESAAAGYRKAGLGVKVVRGIDTSEFNYVPYVQQMKDEGVRFVTYYGPYQFAIRLQKAMEQQNFEPDVYLEDPTIYEPAYVEQGGSAVDGSYVYATHPLFDRTDIQEMALYRSYLEQVAPGAAPNYYGLYAWSAARLFAEQATRLGGKLSRESFVDAVRGVDDWTANDLHAPMHVGAKTTSECVSILQLSGGQWRQVSRGQYLCGPTLATGVGG